MVGTVLTKIKSLLAGASVALFPFVANAQTPHDWFLLTPTIDCVRAAIALPQWPTPLAFHISLRNQGVTDDLARLPFGGVNLKIVGKPGGGMLWYPDQASCLNAQGVAREHGALENRDLW